MEHKLVLGSNLLYSYRRNTFGNWSYGLYSLRMPLSKTRLTGGLSYGTYHAYGFRTTLVDNFVTQTPNNVGSVMIGIEQPLSGNFSFISDWYSGNHALAALITALQYDIGHNILIFGYKFANDKKNGFNAFIFECMINIPTKKNPPHSTSHRK